MSGVVCPSCLAGDHAWHGRYPATKALADCDRQGIPGDPDTPCVCTWRGGPVRIQRRRTPGWRMPEDAVYVGRPTEWGNPWTVGEPIALEWDDRAANGARFCRELTITAELAVALYRIAFTPDASEIRESFAGRDLACWCPLDQPCHADVLLELANTEENREGSR